MQRSLTFSKEAHICCSDFEKKPSNRLIYRSDQAVAVGFGCIGATTSISNLQRHTGNKLCKTLDNATSLLATTRNVQLNKSAQRV
jgi:hypothetical protein